MSRGVVLNDTTARTGSGVPPDYKWACIGSVVDQDLPTVGFFGGERKTGVDPEALVPLQHAIDSATRP
eukprot:2596504-Lingulodinium_polyedra.AAC.1